MQISFGIKNFCFLIFSANPEMLLNRLNILLNSAAAGRRFFISAAQNLKPDYDVVVVGGGHNGLTAVRKFSRKERNTVRGRVIIFLDS